MTMTTRLSSWPSLVSFRRLFIKLTFRRRRMSNLWSGAADCRDSWTYRSRMSEAETDIYELEQPEARLEARIRWIRERKGEGVC